MRSRQVIMARPTFFVVKSQERKRHVSSHGGVLFLLILSHELLEDRVDPESTSGFVSARHSLSHVREISV